MCGESAAGCEFPVSSCDRASSELCSVDYGQFLSFLETDKGKIVCLQQGHDQRVVYDSPCFPVAPPGVCTPYDDVTREKQHRPPPGSRFRIFKDVSYLYTNYSEERLPLSLICDILSEKAGGEGMQLGSAMTFVPCKDAPIDAIGHLFFASGPDLCTLSVGRVVLATGSSSDHPASTSQVSFSEWSHDYAPLFLVFIEAYTLPGKIQHIHYQQVQGRVILCCHSNYHVTLFEVQVPPPSGCSILQCISVYSSDSAILHTRLSPYIAGEVVVVCESGCISLKRKDGEVMSLPSHDQHFILCCYSSQPRSILLATQDNLYQLDMRDRSSAEHLVTLLSGQKVTCLSRDISHPFRVLVATHQTLFLLDTRLPTHHLLAVQHQLTNPPMALSCLHTDTGNTMVLLTSAKHCESVVVCYNGQHDPPYFTLRPHIITTPCEQLQPLRGLSISSSLPLVAWRFSQPAAGSTLIQTGQASFAAVLLTSHGDLFCQIWHYQSLQLPLRVDPSPSPSLCLSPSLRHGYDLWLQEASCQQQELSQHRELPNSSRVDMDTLMQYLVHSPKHLCFNCHYVHTQHFSELDIDQYSLSEPTAAVTPCSCDSEAILSGHDETQHCTFCSDVLNPTRTKPLTSAVGGSGLDSLRVACAVREPQNELEYSLVSGWPMGGAELQNKIFQTDKTPELREKKADEAVKGHEKVKSTPTPTRVSSKARRVGF